MARMTRIVRKKSWISIKTRKSGYIRAHASQNSIIGWMSAVGKEAFYEKYGFMVRPTEKLDAGMTIAFSS